MKRSAIFMATAFVAAIACSFMPRPHARAVATHQYMVAGFSTASSCNAFDCDQTGCNIITNGFTCTVFGATAYSTQGECLSQSGTILETRVAD